ncbi:hypothetical protein PMAYCL1PPCAC_22899, partial [Pristionchus mayeri]
PGSGSSMKSIEGYIVSRYKLSGSQFSIDVQFAIAGLINKGILKKYHRGETEHYGISLRRNARITKITKHKKAFAGGKKNKKKKQQEKMSCIVGEGVCGHKFHFHCITRWLTTSRLCPMCRQVWKLKKLGSSLIYPTPLSPSPCPPSLPSSPCLPYSLAFSNHTTP